MGHGLLVIITGWWFLTRRCEPFHQRVSQLAGSDESYTHLSGEVACPAKPRSYSQHKNINVSTITLAKQLHAQKAYRSQVMCTNFFTSLLVSISALPR
jgi:hypothetical protein